MKSDPAPDERWLRLSGFIAETTGLNFPADRLDDLRRGMMEAAVEFGSSEVDDCVDWLLSAAPTQRQTQVLAKHLTIGETYFFRDAKTFAVLSDDLLPELIRDRRNRGRRLRLWSAGCCTGEEPYSLAIALMQVLPDVDDWDATILGTDINPRFLQKAAAGSYGGWSFRDVPAGFRERYFNSEADGRHSIRPEVRKRVAFAYANLVENVLPSPATGEKSIDLIFCRNVLMYFTPAQARKVIAGFHRFLAEGGCLVVSPSEASQALFPQFAARNYPGVIVYRKDGSRKPAAIGGFELAQGNGSGQPSAAGEIVKLWFQSPAGPAAAAAPKQDAAGSEPGNVPEAQPSAGSGTPPARGQGARPASHEFPRLARACANEGKLAEALDWCDRWTGAEKLNPAAHYLRAVVLLERGEMEAAGEALRRAVYVDPDFVLGHFALGNLARRRRPGDAERHFANALKLLGRMPPEAVVPQSDGLTAARFTETVAALSALEKVP